MTTACPLPSAPVAYAFPDVDVTPMTVPATIGECWILGHLILRGAPPSATMRAAGSESPR